MTPFSFGVIVMMASTASSILLQVSQFMVGI